MGICTYLKIAPSINIDIKNLRYARKNKDKNTNQVSTSEDDYYSYSSSEELDILSNLDISSTTLLKRTNLPNQIKFIPLHLKLYCLLLAYLYLKIKINL